MPRVTSCCPLAHARKHMRGSGQLQMPVQYCAKSSVELIHPRGDRIPPVCPSPRGMEMDHEDEVWGRQQEHAYLAASPLANLRIVMQTTRPSGRRSRRTWESMPAPSTSCRSRTSSRACTTT